MKLAVVSIVSGLCVLAAVGGYVLWTRFDPTVKAAKVAPTTVEPKPIDSPKKTDPPGNHPTDKPVPVILTGATSSPRVSKATGPPLPPTPVGETLVAKVDAAVLLPVPAGKIHTLLVGSAGSMGVVLHRSFDGFAGKGAIDTAERFAIPSGVTAGKLEIAADGVGPGRVTALAPDGSRLAVEGPPGTLAIWHLDKDFEKMPESTVVAFPSADGKSVSVAACCYLKDDRVLVVGPMGQVTVYDTGKKEKVVETGPLNEKPPAEPFESGKSIAVTPDGRTLVLVAGGRVYEVAVNSGKVISSADAVPKTAKIRAVAVDPAGARVFLAFTGDTGPRIAVFPLGADKPTTSLPYFDGLGDPAAASWLGNDCVLVTGTRDPGFVVFDAEVGKWVAYVRIPDSPGPLIRGTDRSYHLVSVGDGKAKLVGVEWPFDDYFKERDFAVNTKSISAYVLTADGLKK